MGFSVDEDKNIAEADRTSGSNTTKADRIIIGIEKSVSDIAQTVKDRAPTGSTFIRADETLGFGVVELPDNTVTADVKGTIESKQDIRYAEEDARGRALFTPDDPKYDYYQYAPQQINAPEAWDTTLGNSDVTICILDTGVKYDHPDLSPNITENVSNGGKDFVDNDDDPYPTDLNGNDGDGNVETHGTHVAGIAAAVTDNSTGISGISNATILCARVLDEDGYGYYSDFASGITWATDKGADIINMSLGGSSDSTTLQDACDYARNNGTLPIAAAGNDEKEYGVDGYHQYPAEYSSVMCVSAANSNEDFAYYSSYGDAVDLIAPGSSVYSTYPVDGDGNKANEYTDLWGTSMATPVVSGVAALILSADSTLSVSKVENILESSARDIGLDSKKQGAGHVNAQDAVETVFYSELTFNPQQPSSGDITVGSVSTSQDSTVVVTYSSNGDEYVAGITPSADNLSGSDVTVTIEDSDGFPGDHTAWVFADAALPNNLSAGDTITSITGEALASETAELTAGSLSVSVGDVTISQGGSATISLTTENADQATVQKLWTDWNISGITKDGAQTDSRVAAAGEYEFTWDSLQAAASPSITVEPPDSTYVGGEYKLTVSVSASGSSDSTTALLQIND